MSYTVNIFNHVEHHFLPVYLPIASHLITTTIQDRRLEKPGFPRWDSPGKLWFIYVQISSYAAGILK